MELTHEQDKLVDTFFGRLSDEDRELLERHLSRRFSSKNRKTGLSIVFDVTRWCDLACRGCCTNAKVFRSALAVPHHQLEMSTDQVYQILDMFKSYVELSGVSPFFVNYGGGEPFLRSDFPEILAYSAKLFGAESVATDTNGTILSLDTAVAVVDDICYLGVSLDGLEKYHNMWRNPEKELNAFAKSVELIRGCLAHPKLREVLEVSSVVSRGNLREIPELVRFLADLGVKKYSAHRTMPVGRYMSILEQIPTREEYLDLAVELARAGQEYGIDVHFHHSLESVYASLLLGIDTHAGDEVLGNPDSRSSLGIDPQGMLYFDPWCTEPPWNQLNAGCLLDLDLHEILSGSEAGVLTLASGYGRKNVRCRGCQVACSGGSRIAAASTVVGRDRRAPLNHLLSGLAAVDPGCPLAELDR